MRASQTSPSWRPPELLETSSSPSKSRWGPRCLVLLEKSCFPCQGRGAYRAGVSLAEQDTTTVTDAGFASLALFTPRLARLRLTNLPRVRGTFIAGLLERCPRLEVLHLENLPSCWEGQGFSSPTASRAKALRTLSILGCKVDMSAAALLAKVSELRSFNYDGPPSLMRVATTFWYVAGTTQM